MSEHHTKLIVLAAIIYVCILRSRASELYFFFGFVLGTFGVYDYGFLTAAKTWIPNL